MLYFSQMLFKGFPDKCDALKVLKDGALETGSSARWATEWEESALPLITKVASLSCALQTIHNQFDHLNVEYCDICESKSVHLNLQFISRSDS